jgi:hypothetical protein
MPRLYGIAVWDEKFFEQELPAAMAIHALAARKLVDKKKRLFDNAT